METLITQGVEITVETYYQQGYAKQHNSEHVFAYRITITNHNPFIVQLLSRKWKITDSNRSIRLVEGEGVVGRQPVLYPNDSYQYISGVNFDTPIGKMEGSYTFENKGNGSFFDALVPAFKMEAPVLLN